MYKRQVINEEEAEAIRVIYDQYVHTDIGANGIAKYLENHGIRKIPRQNGKNPLFDAHLIRLILKNPVYCGKIAYGRRKTEKVRGTRNEYKLVAVSYTHLAFLQDFRAAFFRFLHFWRIFRSIGFFPVYSGRRADTVNKLWRA